MDDAGNEAFPNPGRVPPHAEEMGLGVPVVEVPGDRYLFGVGGPYRKVGPPRPFMVDLMSSKFFVKAKVVSLLEKKNVVVRE
jgi:hypothetical protein